MGNNKDSKNDNELFGGYKQPNYKENNSGKTQGADANSRYVYVSKSASSKADEDKTGQNGASLFKENDKPLNREKHSALQETAVNEVAAEKAKKTSKIILLSIMGVCAIIFIISIVRIVSIVSTYKKAEKEYTGISEKYIGKTFEFDIEEMPENIELEENDLFGIDFTALREINSDIAAWIDIPGTETSYPVMWNGNNDYYLNHTFEGVYNPAGSIFIDARNEYDFTSDHTIIYGHNLKTGKMFGSLSDFEDSGYLNEHKYICIYMHDRINIYEILKVDKTTNVSPTYKVNFSSEEDFASFTSQFGTSSTENLISLSTCVTGPDRDARLIITAQLVESISEDDEVPEYVDDLLDSNIDDFLPDGDNENSDGNDNDNSETGFDEDELNDQINDEND